MIMRLEQAIVYVLVSAGHGMTTTAIAQAINDEKLYLRNDGKPVNEKQVYAVMSNFKQVFAREGGLNYLIM